MKNRKITVKNKMINHIMKNGAKKTSEKILLKSFKELQKFTKKQPINLLKLAIISTTPIFKIHKITNRKRKIQTVKEIPKIIFNQKTKISSAIKFILTTLKTKKSIHFYSKLKKELIISAKNKGFAVQTKNKLQNKITVKKNFISYYRW